MPEKFVFRIDSSRRHSTLVIWLLQFYLKLWRCGGSAGSLGWQVQLTAGLLINGGKHYEPVQFLYRPAVLHKVICQPIEQFRMRGRLGPGAKIAGRPNQGGAKMLHPKSIYKNARGQWVVFTCDCFGE